MAMKKYGILTMERQPGSDLVFRADGLIEGQIVFQFDYGTQFTNVLAALGAGHPDNPGVILYAARISKDRLGKGTVAYDCIGLSKSPTDRIVQGQPQISTTPIEAHPKFATDLAGTSDAPLNNAIWVADDDGNPEFRRFGEGSDLLGTTSFFDGSVVVRGVYYTKTPPTLSKAFTIHNSLPNMPEVPGVVNWLYCPPAWEQVPNTPFFKVSEEFMGSGKKGWNELVYGD